MRRFYELPKTTDPHIRKRFWHWIGPLYEQTNHPCTFIRSELNEVMNRVHQLPSYLSHTSHPFGSYVMAQLGHEFCCEYILNVSWQSQSTRLFYGQSAPTREFSTFPFFSRQTESMLGMLTRAHVGNTFVASNGLNALRWSDSRTLFHGQTAPIR